MHEDVDAGANLAVLDHVKTRNVSLPAVRIVSNQKVESLRATFQSMHGGVLGGIFEM